MDMVRCKCAARRQIAGELPGHPILSFFFVTLDFVELTRAGWTYDAGVWRCQPCTRRKNLMRSVRVGKTSNVTDPSPPSGEKM